MAETLASGAIDENVNVEDLFDDDL